MGVTIGFGVGVGVGVGDYGHGRRRNLDLAFRRRASFGRGLFDGCFRSGFCFRCLGSGRGRFEPACLWRTSSAFHPDNVLRRRSRRTTPPEEAKQDREVDQPDNRDVAPETRVASHLPGCSSCVAIPTLVMSARCQRVHQTNKFLHRQTAIRPNDDGDIGIGAFQRCQPPVELRRRNHFFIQPNDFIAIEESVWTAAGLIGAFVVPLEGMMSVLLFSISGVVIMKMIRRTKARSSSGVMLISESVVREVRLEKRRMITPNGSRLRQSQQTFRWPRYS